MSTCRRDFGSSRNSFNQSLDNTSLASSQGVVSFCARIGFVWLVCPHPRVWHFTAFYSMAIKAGKKERTKARQKKLEERELVRSRSRSSATQPGRYTARHQDISAALATPPGRYTVRHQDISAALATPPGRYTVRHQDISTPLYLVVSSSLFPSSPGRDTVRQQIISASALVYIADTPDHRIYEGLVWKKAQTECLIRFLFCHRGDFDFNFVGCEFMLPWMRKLKTVIPSYVFALRPAGRQRLPLPAGVDNTCDSSAYVRCLLNERRRIQL